MPALAPGDLRVETSSDDICFAKFNFAAKQLKRGVVEPHPTSDAPGRGAPLAEALRHPVLSNPVFTFKLTTCPPMASPLYKRSDEKWKFPLPERAVGDRP